MLRRVFQGNLAGEPLKAQLRLQHIQQHMGRKTRNSAAIGFELIAEQGEVVAPVPQRESRQRQLAEQRQHAVLGRADPLTADLHHITGGELMIERAPADPCIGFQHPHTAAGLLQAPGCRQPGNASAHHHDIKRFHARSCLLLWGTSYGGTTNTTKAGMVKFTDQIEQPDRQLSPTACRP